MKYLLEKKKHSKIKKMMRIIRYDSKETKITRDISKISDARLIWGGDKTIEEIREIKTKARTIDVPFADRYSISIINSDKILQLPNYKFNILLKNFTTTHMKLIKMHAHHHMLFYGMEIKT